MAETSEMDIQPANEKDRLKALHSFNIVYSQSEKSFNNLVQLLAADFSVPAAMINFVDDKHVYVKASVGTSGVQKVDRSISFCSHTILSDQPLIITNARKDPNFCGNPFVNSEWGITFYAGAPLISNDGFNLGVVCLIDYKERTFSKEEEQRLVLFAKLVMHELDLHAAVKRQQDELEKHQRQLQDSFQLARIGSWEYDVDNMRATWSNELYDIYGVDKKSVKDDLLSVYLSLVHPEDFTTASKILQHPDGIPHQQFVRLIKPDGKITHISHSIRKAYDQQGKLVKLIGLSQDITERAEYELQIQKNEQKFKSLVQHGSDLIGIIDIQGNYKYVGDSVRHILGFEPEDFQNRNAFEFIHPEDQKRVADCLALVVSNKHVEIPSFRFKDINGHWRWVETKVANLLDDPLINGFVVNSRDITEHKKAENALRVSEQKFKSLVQNSSDIIVILDEQGNFTYISDNAITFLGYHPQEMEGHNAFELVHAEDVDKVKEEFLKVRNHDGSTLAVSHRFRSGDGTWMWLESKGINHFSDPLIRGMIVNARDITDRVKLQQKLDNELQNRQLLITKAVIDAQEKERSQVGLELHDNVNQVLTTVKLYQELCLDGLGNREELIKKSVNLLQESINEIRSLSKRLSAPTLGSIKLHDSVKELLDAVAATEKLRITYNTVDLIDKEVDAEVHLAIYRILQEHLTNILKHAFANQAEVLLIYQDHHLHMEVADNGVGFDVGKKSNGIGITNMKTRAESLKGNIHFVSAPGIGCKLVVDLPCSQ